MNRIGDWMQTASAAQFWPLDPRPEEVRIGDIAHSLAHQCRFAGHCRTFYSVAEHSVRVAWLAQEYVTEDYRNLVALVALLHDASEAYLVDLPRPVKRCVPGYKEAEARVQLAILKRYGLVEAWDAYAEIIKTCDNRLLATEARDLMGPPPAPWVQMPPPIDERIEPWSPYLARNVFIQSFEIFGGKEP